MVPCVEQSSVTSSSTSFWPNADLCCILNCVWMVLRWAFISLLSFGGFQLFSWSWSSLLFIDLDSLSNFFSMIDESCVYDGHSLQGWLMYQIDGLRQRISSSIFTFIAIRSSQEYPVSSPVICELFLGPVKPLRNKEKYCLSSMKLSLRARDNFCCKSVYILIFIIQIIPIK